MWMSASLSGVKTNNHLPFSHVMQKSEQHILTNTAVFEIGRGKPFLGLNVILTTRVFEANLQFYPTFYCNCRRSVCCLLFPVCAC